MFLIYTIFFLIKKLIQITLSFIFNIPKHRTHLVHYNDDYLKLGSNINMDTRSCTRITIVIHLFDNKR